MCLRDAFWDAFRMPLGRLALMRPLIVTVWGATERALSYGTTPAKSGLLHKSGDLIGGLPDTIQAGSREDGTDSTAPGAGFWQTQTSDSATTSKVSVSTAPAGECDGVCMPPGALVYLTGPMQRGGNCAFKR